jgi:DNA-binding LacI/PurR family transcriptional regulator
VAPETRRKVEQAIQELKYVPNMLARNFRTSQSKSILVILTSISNLFYMELVRGISEYANQKGYDILLSETNGDSKKQIACLEKVKNRITDGAIIIETTVFSKALMTLEESNPVVQCCSHNDKVAMPYVRIDNVKGGYLAGKVLLDAGCRNLVFVGNQGSSQYNIERRQGFLKAAAEVGLQESDIYEINAELSFQGGRQAAEDILVQKKTDGVFFVSDMLAIGAMQIFQKQGVRVPEDISIIGYDNLEICEMVTPTLSSIAQPAMKMGEEGARLLIDRINNVEDINYKNVIFQPELVLRNSVRKS